MPPGYETSFLPRFTAPLFSGLALGDQLDDAYRRASKSLAVNTDVRIEKRKGRDRLCVTPLDKLDEPESLIELRDRVNALIPRVDLPEALLEVQRLPGSRMSFSTSTIAALKSTIWRSACVRS